MDPLLMEEAMMKNMVTKTGRSIDDWIKLVKENNFIKHVEIVKFLKEKCSITHGYANLIARKSK